MNAHLAQHFPSFKNDQRVFAIITPSTPHSFTRNYRPKPYFVLQTMVDGERPYGFQTDFFIQPGRAFADLEEAKKRLVKIFADETDGELKIEKVRLVSMSEEIAGEAVITRNIHERHTVSRHSA